MSQYEVLYMKGMDISETDGEEGGDEDIWDDRKLNDAYDKALRIANAEVARRIAMSTNNHETNEGKGPFTQGTEQSKSKKSKSASKLNASKKSQWKAGMTCRAVYEADGLEYEAFVQRIINEEECVVKFLGYNNSEIVPINTLRHSLGKEHQARQIEEAEIANNETPTQSVKAESMEYVNGVTSPESKEKLTKGKKKQPKKKKSPKPSNESNGFVLPELPFQMPNFDALRNLGSPELSMPPPPPMTIPVSNRIDCEDQALSSMLLSWYMSGYYTGLYQGMKRAKETHRNH